MSQTKEKNKCKTNFRFLSTKKNIKFVLIAGTLLSSTISQAEVVGQMPTLKPTACAYSILVPEGLTNRTYFSRDCKTVYITPREIGNLRFSKALKVGSASPEICRAVQKRKIRLENLPEALDKADKKIEDLREKLESASPEMVARYKDLITMYENDKINYKNELENGWAPFDTWPAARVQAFFETGLMQDVELFRKANEKLSNVSIQPMPINSGTLYFTPANKNSVRYKGVLSIQVPGKTIQNVNGQLPLSSVEMNGGLSGLVELSVPMVCDIVANPADIENKDLSGSIVGNYYYTFYAEAGVKLQASAMIAAEDLGKIVNQDIQKAQFTRNELLNTVYNGNLMSHLMVSIDDGGHPVNKETSVLFKENEDGKTLTSILLGQVFAKYFEQIENKLIFNEYVSKMDVPAIKEVEPGEVTIPNGIVQVCSSQSALFGIIQSRHCRQQVVYKKVPVAGRSEGRNTTIDNQKLTFSFDVHEQQSIPVVHTMTFGTQNQN